MFGLTLTVAVQQKLKYGIKSDLDINILIFMKISQDTMNNETNVETVLQKSLFQLFIG